MRGGKGVLVSKMFVEKVGEWIVTLCGDFEGVVEGVDEFWVKLAEREFIHNMAKVESYNTTRSASLTPQIHFQSFRSSLPFAHQIKYSPV